MPVAGHELRCSADHAISLDTARVSACSDPSTSNVYGTGRLRTLAWVSRRFFYQPQAGHSPSSRESGSLASCTRGKLRCCGGEPGSCAPNRLQDLGGGAIPAAAKTAGAGTLQRCGTTMRGAPECGARASARRVRKACVKRS